MTIVRSKPLLCLLNVKHHWVEVSTEDGQRYERCSKCGKDRMDYPWGIDLKKGMTFGAG